MIVFDRVVLRYPYDEFDLLKGASFTLQNGVNTVLADAQSGKTSICKLLLKDVAPTSGQIFVGGQEISGITNSNLDILYLPSNPVFFERRSVAYNMEYPLKVRKVDKSCRRQRASEIATQFGLDLDEKVSRLNAQQRRALALARGLTVKRKIALLDDCLDGNRHVEDIARQFDCCVILTSDVSLATGHTVVLDGGLSVYEGDADGAQQAVKNLYWLSCQ